MDRKDEDHSIDICQCKGSVGNAVGNKVGIVVGNFVGIVVGNKVGNKEGELVQLLLVRLASEVTHRSEKTTFPTFAVLAT